MRLFDASVYRSPRESGGGATVDAEEMVDVVVNGEVIAQIPKSDTNQLSDLGKWRKTLTHEADVVAAGRKEVASVKAETATERATFARERADAGTTARTEAKVAAVEEAGISTKNFPSYVDDPEGFMTSLDGALEQAANKGYERAKREFEGKLENTRRASETASTVTAAASQVFSDNQRVVDNYIQEMKEAGTPLNAEDTAELIDYMDTQLRLPKKGYAERDSVSGKIRFTRDAAAAADQIVRGPYYKERYKEEGLREGIKQRGLSVDFEPAAEKPASNASPKQKADYALGLTTAQMERYIANLSDAEENEVLLHIYKEAGEAGATQLLRPRSDD
jgi:hypothetical protein